jgi:predicted phage terminase large subunit-like protein
MRDGYKFRIVARGSEQKMRGLKWGSKRPDLMIFDDMEDDEQVENKDRREKLAKWVLNAAIPAGKKAGCLYRLVGTVMHFDSFLENSLNDGFWLARRFRAHNSFDDFGGIIWASKFSEDWFRAKRAMYVARGNPDGYSQEYLNNPVSEQEAYFHRQDLVGYPASFKPLEQRRSLRVYAGWDFAVSKEERTDFTAVAVVGVDAAGYKYVLDVRRGRWDTKDIIDQMFMVEKAWHPEFHAVEKGTIEKAIGPFLKDQMRVQGTYLNLYPLSSTKDKRIRAKSWQGAVSARHIHFDHDAPWWLAVRDEMIRFPKGEHDDMVDAMSIIGRLLEDVHEGPTEAEIKEDEDDDLAFERRTYIQHGRSEVTGY